MLRVGGKHFYCILEVLNLNLNPMTGYFDCLFYRDFPATLGQFRNNSLK